MGRVVVSEFVSIDGVFEDPGGSEGSPHAGWTFNRGDEGDRFKLDETFGADALLLGRRTYEGFAQAWPGRTDEVGFAAKMNEMPKHVVSTTLQRADWHNSHVIREAPDAAVRELKDQYAADILVAGSGQLVRYLLHEGLVNKLRLMVFPTILGSGASLLSPGAGTHRMSLASHRSVGPDGVMILTYQPDNCAPAS